jgi:hypothetical protein
MSPDELIDVAWIPRMKEEVVRLRAEKALLRKALQPFIAFALAHTGDSYDLLADTCSVTSHPTVNITMADLRALARIPEAHNPSPEGE